MIIFHLLTLIKNIYYILGDYFDDVDGVWSPRMMKCFGFIFFDVAMSRDNILYHWVFLLGNEAIAKNYTYEIAAFNGNIK